MKKNTIYLLLIFFIYVCSSFNKTPNNLVFKVDFIELRYGICETKPVYTEQMSDSPSGNRTLSTGFNLIEQTDKIPGKIGQKFGMEYNLKSNITEDILVEQVWIFPKSIVDDNGKRFNEVRYKVKKPTNEKIFSTYVLEKDYEIVTGEWTYQMFYDGKKLHERKFYIE